MMKYLLVIVVVIGVVAFYYWRYQRMERLHKEAKQAQQGQRQTSPKPLAAPDDIVTCHHCGLHLPSREATIGSHGYYCGQEHRRLAED